MKLFALPLLFLFLSCSSSANTQNSNEIPPSAPNTEEEPASTSSQTPGLSMAELFPLSDASALIGCQAEPSVKKDDRDYRTSVTYSCTDPFVILSAALVWTKDGNKQDVSRRDSNPALEKISVSGADAAHLVEAQGRLMVAKGKYLLTVQMPNSGREKLISIAEKVLQQL